ncbi:ABC transporter substrate-binding protein [Paenibacillus sp. GCM10027626]|uniref:ABC transporter substrate-binding protein n=1 Tax=Paenibacillus sp. GCM10027626 TaxID=3273411 RepID=UPI0036430684
MKRWSTVALTTVVASALAFTGCAKKEEPPVNEGTNKGNNQETEKVEPPKQTEKVKLTIGSWRTEDTEAYKKIIAAFNETNPDIEIEFKPTKNTEYNTVLNTALQTGGGPDIIHLRPYAAGKQLADGGYLEPLDNLQGMDVFSKDTLLAATGSDGKVYGVPTVFSSTQIFYNKKLFEQYNLQEPKTWDELLKVADTLKQNKVTPFAFGSKEGWLLSLTHGALGPSSYGGSDFTNKVASGEAKLTDPAYIDSIKAMKDLVPYFPDNYVGLGMDDIRNLFVTEQAGMFVMGDWEVAVMKKMNPDLQLDLFPVPPKDAGGKATVTTWVDGSFAVNKASANKEAAMKFVEFMTTKQFGEIVINELQKPSTIPGVSAADPLVSKIAQNADTIATPYMAVVYLGGGNPTTKATLETSLQGMYLDKMTPEQVADEVQKSADTWFQPQK